MNSVPLMKENKYGLVSNFIGWLVIPLAIISVTNNIVEGNIVRPTAFFIVIGGFVLFTIGKFSVIITKKRVSFGPKLMSENMSNLYRLGYWIMAIGIILTFLP